MIQFTANGQTYNREAGLSLANFLEELSLKPGLVVVEVNGTALRPAETADKVLQDGDRLEIVRIVAGG
jgi:thiamine biosynthesis protein ThiS